MLVAGQKRKHVYKTSREKPEALQMLVSAWNAVSTETIVNLFRKAGISTANQEVAITDDNDPFKNLQNEVDALRNLQTDH